MAILPAIFKNALKEWAVTVEAIMAGRQIILLRKGGIREEHPRFELKFREFFLYPTHYHESETLIKKEARDLLEAASADDMQDIITLSVFAEVVEAEEVRTPSELDALYSMHIWNEEYAEKRLHWRPSQPLTLLIIRAHVLQQPQALMVMESYKGCNSWVEFIEDYPVGVTHPAIPQRRFEDMRHATMKALEDNRRNA